MDKRKEANPEVCVLLPEVVRVFDIVLGWKPNLYLLIFDSYGDGISVKLNCTLYTKISSLLRTSQDILGYSKMFQGILRTTWTWDK